MNSIERECYEDLYRASEDIDGKPGDFDKLYDIYGENIPYNRYYISEYKLHRIIREYANKIPASQQVEFIDKIYAGLAPTASYNSFIRANKN